MNKTIQALVIKLLMTFLAAWIAFGFIDTNTLTNIFILSVLGAALNYLIGDLLILPSQGNITASVCDGLLGALTAYLYSLIMPQFTTTFLSLLIFAAIIAAAEFYFHKYLLRTEEVAPNKTEE
jgi:hypothetical protein